MLLDRSRLAMNVTHVHCELGHLIGGGRLETYATNSKLRGRGGEREMNG